MPLKLLLPLAQKLFLVLAVLVAIGAAASLVEGLLGWGETYFGSALLAALFAGVFWGLSFAAGAAHASLHLKSRK